MSLDTAVRHVRGVAVVCLSGDLTLGSACEIARSTVEALIENGDSRILLDCAGLKQVDSAGIGELLSCHVLANRRAGTLKLAGARDRLANSLKLTGLGIMLECFPDEQSALASFADAGPPP